MQAPTLWGQFPGAGLQARAGLSLCSAGAFEENSDNETVKTIIDTGPEGEKMDYQLELIDV